MPHIRQLNHSIDLLALHRVNPRRYPYLLQSTARGTASARFDILFAFPGDEIRLSLDDDLSTDFLNELDRQWQQSCKNEDDETGMPFTGGWFLYLGYELARQVEPSLSLPHASDGLPTASAIRIPAAIIYDHQQSKSHIVAEIDQEDLIELIQNDIDQSSANITSLDHISITMSEENAEQYTNASRGQQ